MAKTRRPRARIPTSAGEIDDDGTQTPKATPREKSPEPEPPRKRVRSKPVVEEDNESDPESGANGSEESSSPPTDDDEDMCKECGKQLKDTDERYKHQNIHKACGSRKTSCDYALKPHPQLQTAMNTMRKKKPGQYQKMMRSIGDRGGKSKKFTENMKNC